MYVSKMCFSLVYKYNCKKKPKKNVINCISGDAVRIITSDPRIFAFIPDLIMQISWVELTDKHGIPRQRNCCQEWILFITLCDGRLPAAATTFYIACISW